MDYKKGRYLYKELNDNYAGGNRQDGKGSEKGNSEDENYEQGNALKLRGLCLELTQKKRHLNTAALPLTDKGCWSKTGIIWDGFTYQRQKNSTLS